MKMYGDLTLALGGEWSASRSCAMPPRETALDMDAVEEETHVLSPAGNFNPDSSVVQLIA
jgi:hypothetical protein